MPPSVKMTGDLKSQLMAINTMALSTSSSAEGRIGMIGDRVVKFNTHWWERAFGDKKSEAMVNSCNTLRTTLAELSYRALTSAFEREAGTEGFQNALDGILKDLGVTESHNKKGETKFRTEEKNLLDRKVVAKVIKDLSELCFNAQFNRLTKDQRTTKARVAIDSKFDLRIGEGTLMDYASENEDTTFSAVFGQFNREAAIRRVEEACDGNPHSVTFTKGERAQLASELRANTVDSNKSYQQVVDDMNCNPQKIVLVDESGAATELDGSKKIGEGAKIALKKFFEKNKVSEAVVKKVLPLCHQSKNTFLGLMKQGEDMSPSVTGFVFGGEIKRSSSEDDKVTLTAMGNGSVRVEIVGEGILTGCVKARVPNAECTGLEDLDVGLQFGCSKPRIAYRTVFEISKGSSEDPQVVCTDASITYKLCLARNKDEAFLSYCESFAGDLDTMFGDDKIRGMTVDDAMSSGKLKGGSKAFLTSLSKDKQDDPPNEEWMKRVTVGQCIKAVRQLVEQLREQKLSGGKLLEESGDSDDLSSEMKIGVSLDAQYTEGELFKSSTSMVTFVNEIKERLKNIIDNPDNNDEMGGMGPKGAGGPDPQKEDGPKSKGASGPKPEKEGGMEPQKEGDPKPPADYFRDGKGGYLKGEDLLKAAKEHPIEFVDANNFMNMLVLSFKRMALNEAYQKSLKDHSQFPPDQLDQRKQVIQILLEDKKCQEFVKELDMGSKMPNAKYLNLLEHTRRTYNENEMSRIYAEKQQAGLNDGEKAVLTYGLKYNCGNLEASYERLSTHIGVPVELLKKAGQKELGSLVESLSRAKEFFVIDMKVVNTALGRAFAKGLFRDVDAKNTQHLFHLLASLQLLIDDKDGKYDPNDLLSLAKMGLRTDDVFSIYQAIKGIQSPRDWKSDDVKGLKDWRLAVAAAFVANGSTCVGLAEFIKRSYGNEFYTKSPVDFIKTLGRVWTDGSDKSFTDPVFGDDRHSHEKRFAEALLKGADITSEFSAEAFVTFYDMVKGLVSGETDSIKADAGGVKFSITRRKDGSLTGTIKIGEKDQPIGVAGTAMTLLQQLRYELLRDFKLEDKKAVEILRGILDEATKAGFGVRELSVKVLGTLLGQPAAAYQSIATKTLVDTLQGVLAGKQNVGQAKEFLAKQVKDGRSVSITAEEALEDYRKLSSEEKSHVSFAPVETGDPTEEDRKAKVEEAVRAFVSDALAGKKDLAESHAQALEALKEGAVVLDNLWSSFPTEVAKALREFLTAVRIGSDLNEASKMLQEKSGALAKECADKLAESIKKELDAMKEANASGEKLPVWKQTLAEIANATKLDFDSPYGKYVYNAMTTYFKSLKGVDSLALLQTMVRDGKGEGNAAFLTAAFKGAGPLFQKLLQGLPQEGFSEPFRTALSTVNDNLAPIDREFVLAQINRLRTGSKGMITDIEVKESLGAASVGEAFLCLVKTPQMPLGENCVIKVLRPGAAPRAARERVMLLEAAKEAGDGFVETLRNQFDAIDRELDLQAEADNAKAGFAVYHKRDVVGRVMSMELHESGLCTTDAVILKQAKGETLSKKFDEVVRQLAELENRKRSGLGETVQDKQALAALYDQMRRYQSDLVDLCERWNTEMMYGSGFFHADLHAGNIMADANGLTLVDYGNVAKMSEDDRKAMIGIVAGAVSANAEYLLKGFEKLSGGVTLSPGVRDLIKRQLNEVLPKGNGNDAGSRIAVSLQIIQKNGVALPPILSSYSQGQIRLQATLARANAILESISLANRTMGIESQPGDGWPKGLFMGEVVDSMRKTGGDPTPLAVKKLEEMRTSSPYFADFEKGAENIAHKVGSGMVPPVVSNMIEASREGNGPEFDHRHLEKLKTSLVTMSEGFDGMTSVDGKPDSSSSIGNNLSAIMQALNSLKNNADGKNYNPKNPLDVATTYGRKLCLFFDEVARQQIKMLKAAASLAKKDVEIADQVEELKTFSDTMMSVVTSDISRTIDMVTDFTGPWGIFGMGITMKAALGKLYAFNKNMDSARANIKKTVADEAKSLQSVPSSVTAAIPRVVANFPVGDSIIPGRDESDKAILDRQMAATRELLKRSFDENHLKNGVVQQMIVNTAETLFGKTAFCVKLKGDISTWFG